VPRYDLSYQLNEIEARAEDYSEALAFVRLLNALWRAGGADLPDEGRGVAHLSKFVREDLLGTAFQVGKSWRLKAVVAAPCHSSGCTRTADPQPVTQCLCPYLQRAYREERQRWQLVAACLEHCELTLTSLRSGAAGYGGCHVVGAATWHSSHALRRRSLPRSPKLRPLHSCPHASSLHALLPAHSGCTGW
jgi:hypothetical protein